MKKSKFSEHQIVNILKEYESGKAQRIFVENMVFQRRLFYQWKQKYGGMDAQHL